MSVQGINELNKKIYSYNLKIIAHNLNTVIEGLPEIEML